MSRMGNNTAARDTGEAQDGSSPVETAKALTEAREALRNYEASALVDVAATLAQTAECLARTARELKGRMGSQRRQHQARAHTKAS
jgi:hypothetical protein